MERQHNIPKNWAITTFGDIIELVYGKGLPKNSRNAEGKFPVYGSNGVVGYHDGYLVDGPVIVVGRKGAAGIPTYAKENCWPIDTTYYVKSAEIYDLKFVYYLIHNLRLDRFDRSTAIPGLNRDDAYSLDIWLPPLNEQRRIVAKIEELFSDLNEGIESLKTAQEQLKVYRQAVLKHAFEGKLTTAWREGNKSHLESSKSILEHILKTRRQQWREKGKYKEPQTPDAANLSDLPPGWVWVTVDHLLTETLMNGHSVRDSTNGFPVLRLTALKSGKIDLSERKKGDWTEKDAEPYLVSQGDFYVSRGNGSKKLVGIGGLVVEKPEPIAFPDTFIRIRINSNICDINYLSLLWNSHLLRSQIEKCARTTAGIYKINQGDICSFVIPLPSVEEQKEIIYQLEDVLSKISNLEDSCETELVRSETLRQSILKKAFSGKLVAQNTDDEPASVLLERIQAEKAAVSTPKQQAKTKRNAVA